MLPVAFMLSYNKIRKLDFSSNMLALQRATRKRFCTYWNWTNRTINITITFSRLFANDKYITVIFGKTTRD